MTTIFEQRTEETADYTDFGLAVLCERLDKMHSLVEAVRDAHESGDIEAIHDMRVASRRLRAAITVFMPLFAGPAFRRFEREVKAVTRALGAARDLDVMIDRLRRMEESLPETEQAGIDRFIKEMERRREKAQRDVLASLARLEAAQLDMALDEIGQDRDPEPTDLRPPAVLMERVTDLLSWEPYIEDPADVAELHAMRIAAKHLRYTMEIFAPLYAEEFGSAIGRVREIQQFLGDIHDADVLVPALAAHLRRELKAGPRKQAACGVYVSDFDGALGLLTQCRRLRAEREKTYSGFLRAWYRLRMDGYFDKLWIMARKPRLPESDTKIESSEAAPAVVTVEAALNGGADAARERNGTEPRQEDAADRRPHRTTRRRERPVVHTGNGSDSGAGAEEGGV